MEIIRKTTLHFTKGMKQKPWVIVIHATGASTAASTISWFGKRESRVSSHYLVDKDGSVYQFVDECDTAWHAGVSEWQGKTSCNHFSIGIELVNKNDGSDTYPFKQLKSCAILCSDIIKRYDIKDENIVGHGDIAPKRKPGEPVGFPWLKLRNLIKEGLWNLSHGCSCIGKMFSMWSRISYWLSQLSPNLRKRLGMTT